MKQLLPFFLCLLLTASLLSCEAAPYTVDFFAFDTYNYIRVYSDRDRDAAVQAQTLCLSFDRTASAYDANSELSLINQSCGGTVGTLLLPILRRSLELRDYTDGSFDPTLLTLSQLWNIGTESFRIPSDEELQIAREPDADVLLSDNVVDLQGCMLDFGGIMKGYACSAVLSSLRAAGVRRALVSLGGNIGVISDTDPFKIGIADPNDPSRMLGALTLTEGILSVSGSYERYSESDGVRYSHILDPRTGRPVTGDLSCSVVVGQDGALCDAVSTALFVMGFDRAASFAEAHAEDFSVLLIRENGEIYLSKSLKESFVFEND
ncbi:MAG: FAD:protein FMN transferase [Eubacteriales bacterium]